MGKDLDEGLWQDRDIRFDCAESSLKLRNAEVKIDSIQSVEDTKGNKGDRGELTITNMRLLWQSYQNPKINLSIGYGCFVNAKIKQATSRLRGTTQALFLMTKFSGNNFEFIFTSLVKSSPKLFVTVRAVFKSYETTRLYRDLKLRGAIIQDKELALLPHEQIYSKIEGVWNLSADQGNLGVFFITNVRLVWHAKLAENFNVSMPYIQIQSMRIRESKFGVALVVETTARSGGFILGFRIDPQERLPAVYKELQSLWQVFSVSPVFGVEYVLEDKGEEETPPRKAMVRDDDVEIVDDQDQVDAFAIYCADGGAAAKEGAENIEYNPEIGLAMEAVPSNLTAQKLWEVIYR